MLSAAPGEEREHVKPSVFTNGEVTSFNDAEAADKELKIGVQHCATPSATAHESEIPSAAEAEGKVAKLEPLGELQRQAMFRNRTELKWTF